MSPDKATHVESSVGMVSGAGWTVETLRIHMEALRTAEVKFQDERDRRYTELQVLRDAAKAEKEEAERNALLLDREVRSYKDEKANQLREQIGAERGLYATKPELGTAIDSLVRSQTAAVEKILETLKPVQDYVAAQRGPRALTAPVLLGAITFILGTIIAIIGIVAYLSK